MVLLLVFSYRSVWCLEEEAEAEESDPDYEEGQEEDFEEGKS